MPKSLAMGCVPRSQTPSRRPQNQDVFIFYAVIIAIGVLLAVISPREPPAPKPLPTMATKPDVHIHMSVDRSTAESRRDTHPQ